MNIRLSLCVYLAVFPAVTGCAASVSPQGNTSGPSSVIVQTDTSPLIALAAEEARRYIYCTTGELLPVVTKPDNHADCIVIGTQTNPAIKKLLDRFPQLKASFPGPESYCLKSAEADGRKLLVLTGAGEVAALYAAYRLAEHLGVRFYLHGDVIPDRKKKFVFPEFPKLDLEESPLFAKRGIQPFHDFPEGPDWWNRDDYKAVFAQLVKMRMNFFGLHTYPEGGVGPEPAVWIGGKKGLQADGTVTASYPSRHFTTPNPTGSWGYRPMKTGEYAFGAAQLFEADDYGASYMTGVNPWPQASSGRQNKLFNDMGAFLNDIFQFAQTIGIATCIGTETPLTIPQPVRKRLESEGKDPSDSKVVQQVYEAMFSRIKKTHPLDYYWFWTPESWTWSGTRQEHIDRTIADLKAAVAASDAVDAPFTLATCGWVLGPQQDRALFDRFLPKEMPFSCINRQVGFAFVEDGFTRVENRSKWAIPWLEDDPALIIPQLWAGRMRRDAVDALKYGCDGLMGIHWRTRILGPNASSLAKAAWDQSWNQEDDDKEEIEKRREKKEGYIQGNNAAFPNNKIAATDDDPIYRTVRYNVDRYQVKVPKGVYTVTLKFCEPHYEAKGKRVFAVTLQGKQVIKRLDIFEEVGKNKALDFTFENVTVAAAPLAIAFDKIVEYPSIAGIVIKNESTTRRINCGGPAWHHYEADLPALPAYTRDRDLPVQDFYRDWCLSQFGSGAQEELAKLFIRLDGGYLPNQRPYRDNVLPRPSTWVGGPGGIVPAAQSWEEARNDYLFVDQMEQLREKILGAGNRARFDFWLYQFKYLRATGKVSCTWGAYARAAAQVKKEKDAEAKQKQAETVLLPLRRQLVKDIAEAVRLLLHTVHTPGGLGNVANWQQHVMKLLLVNPGKELEAALGRPLPPEAMPSKTYSGPVRLFVPTVRSVIQAGESLTIKAVCQGAKAENIEVFHRPLGEGAFKRKPFEHLNRAVYSVTLPAEELDKSFEYYIDCRTTCGKELSWPATAASLNQTVVVMPSK